VTVHDLLPVITLSRPVKQLRDRVRNRLLHRVLDNLRRYDAWIVATNWLRDELAQWLDRPATQIHVVPYGVDPAYFEPTQNGAAQELREAWKIPPEAFVVLHVGSVGPRKNFGSVVAVVDDLRREGLDARLVQAGGLPSAEHRRDIAKRGLTDVVRWLGPAPESTLRLAYRASNILLFPSHYEGFGLPVLEAMASGLPAVTSGAGGLTEVGGDAAIVVGGREVRPYTEAVCRVAGDAELRQTMSRTGIAWASRFDWSATARQTASVYRELTEQRA
jgi:alpha-1,3-rhamnosyl/mannosyltransferase